MTGESQAPCYDLSTCRRRSPGNAGHGGACRRCHYLALRASTVDRRSHDGLGDGQRGPIHRRSDRRQWALARRGPVPAPPARAGGGSTAGRYPGCGTPASSRGGLTTGRTTIIITGRTTNPTTVRIAMRRRSDTPRSASVRIGFREAGAAEALPSGASGLRPLPVSRLDQKAGDPGALAGVSEDYRGLTAQARRVTGDEWRSD